MKKASKPTAKMRAAKRPVVRTGETVTQIAVTSNAYGGSGRVIESVTALCADGTIWRYPMVGADPENMVWTQIPAIGTTGKTSPKE
jgi:hypothetical protein